MVQLFEVLDVAVELKVNFAFRPALFHFGSPFHDLIDGVLELVDAEGFGEIEVCADVQASEFVFVLVRAVTMIRGMRLVERSSLSSSQMS